MRNDGKGVVVVVGAVCVGIVVLVLAHAGTANTTPRAAHPPGTRCARNVSGTTTPQCVRVGHPLYPRHDWKLEKRGTVVASADLFGDRVFANADDGIALANGDNAQYPALSVDGGRTWRIGGPQLHVDALDGAEGVGYVGVGGPRTFFAYGSSVVDVTSDGGRSWRETFLGENVTAVVAVQGRGLVAYVQNAVNNAHPLRAFTWQYISRDGGRHWRYSTAMAG
jgi:hypothetical protein